MAQHPDGGFAQNFWVNGDAYWSGIQLDETAFPIMLAWRLHCEKDLADFDPLNLVRNAAAYLIRNGPVTQQERWEEASGYSPSTLASNIAALICASPLFHEIGNHEAATFVEGYADYLEAHIEEWTTTTTGTLLDGTNLKVSSMEPGGSDAFIVLEDADLEKTIPWAVWGRMYNAGQTCCASKRFIVVEEIADKFLEKFTTALSALKPGDPMDEKTTHGPLSTESALVQLLKQVDIAVAQGAKVALGGKRIDRDGSYMEATILTDMTPDNPAFRDEFFGPVALFFRVKDEAAAIALANDSDFGLGGSVFTKDVARGMRVATQVETGMMFINNIDWSDAELPFGGIKDSGYGREVGNMGIQEFVNKKLVRTHDMVAPLV